MIVDLQLRFIFSRILESDNIPGPVDMTQAATHTSTSTIPPAYRGNAMDTVATQSRTAAITPTHRSNVMSTAANPLQYSRHHTSLQG